MVKVCEVGGLGRGVGGDAGDLEDVGREEQQAAMLDAPAG
jgi:hypothetical protein